ncbi:hypothetical protein HY572_00345 [Candidatus Micrarchaeota archaeon]|nr:hypothetical protein [Candidatus Micrarchaeota archaeon]
MVLPVLAALVLSGVHLFSHEIEEHVHRYRGHVVSLSAGLFLTYLLLELFPRIALDGSVLWGRSVFAFLLLGFTAYHLLEKHAYQHHARTKQQFRELTQLHAAGFALDGFIIGVFLVLFFIGQPGGVQIAAFIPLLLHSLSASLTLQHLQTRFKQPETRLLALTPLAGALAATAVPLPQATFYAVLAFLTGVLLYVTIRHALPQGRDGHKALFVAGVAAGYLFLEFARLPF